MDLKDLNTTATAEKGAACTLRHPVTDEKTDIILTLAGSDSRRYKTANHMIQNRSLSRGKFKITAEKLEANALEILAACVIGWKNVEDSDLFPKGTPECTADTALAFLGKHAWAKEQVDTFIADRANFLPRA